MARSWLAKVYLLIIAYATGKTSTPIKSHEHENASFRVFDSVTSQNWHEQQQFQIQTQIGLFSLLMLQLLTLFSISQRQIKGCRDRKVVQNLEFGIAA
jgi:hypothetical protein